MLSQFPDFMDVDLSCKDVFDDFITRHPLEASEYTFTNLFAFRKTYDFRLSLLQNNLIILRGADPVSVFSPIGSGNITNLSGEIFTYLRGYAEHPYMERVTESFIQAYLKDNNNFIIEEQRDHFDYLYHVKDLIELKGNKFHDKKNKANRFRSSYQYRYERLKPGLIDECLAYEDEWCEARECGKYPGLDKEYCAIREMLYNFSRLNMTGGIIRVDGKIVALTLGEKLLNDTMVIHIEKANSEMQGLYQVINQEFLMHEARDCTYVNREQDLGIEGLRHSKMTYNPLRFVKKYIVRENRI